ncbi:energy transducer TonB [Glaciecola sp. 1036]|uniref:energy transducer TonB n=1 Tax=Alteromonadaceae TaxID=72275 RepID=UPI003D0002E3
MKLILIPISLLFLFACSQNTETSKKPLSVDEKDLALYWIADNNGHFLIDRNALSNISSPGWVEVSYVIDEQGNVQELTLIASDEKQQWNSIALQGIESLHYQATEQNPEQRQVQVTRKLVFNMASK